MITYQCKHYIFYLPKLVFQNTVFSHDNARAKPLFGVILDDFSFHSFYCYDFEIYSDL